MRQLRLNSLRCALMSARSANSLYVDRTLHFHTCSNGSFLPCFDGQCTLLRLRGKQA